MPGITSFLPRRKLSDLRNQFKRKSGKSQMQGILRCVLPDMYADSKAYVDAIVHTYFDPKTDKMAKHGGELNQSDRERCIIALLAAQGGQFTLALHIYLGLMNNIPLAEVAHTLLLAGVYTGVNRFAEGMFVYVKTLKVLASLTGDVGPDAVNKALRVAFGVS